MLYYIAFRSWHSATRISIAFVQWEVSEPSTILDPNGVEGPMPQVNPWKIESWSYLLLAEQVSSVI